MSMTDSWLDRYFSHMLLLLCYHILSFMLVYFLKNPYILLWQDLLYLMLTFFYLYITFSYTKQNWWKSGYVSGKATSSLCYSPGDLNNFAYITFKYTLVEDGPTVRLKAWWNVFQFRSSCSLAFSKKLFWKI